MWYTLSNIDIPQNEYNILPKYDIEKEFNLHTLAIAIYFQTVKEGEAK